MRSARGSFSLFWIGAALATASSCHRSPSTTTAPAIAREIVSPKELLWGPCAFGALGDIMIDNGLMLAVITKRVRSNGFATSPGNLVDVASIPQGTDHLNELFLYINDDFPRQAHYNSTEIISHGGGSKPALVRASGTDSKDERIRIETEYRLNPGAKWLTITSKFTSTATTPIRGYQVGDAIQWGRTRSMAPGHGFNLDGRRIATGWIAGLGEDTSYALVPDGPHMFDTPNGSMWSDPIGAKVDLAPHKTFSYVRHLVVGSGDTASLAPIVSKLRGDQTGQIAGSVTSDGQAVMDAVVRIFDAQDQIFGLARANRQGWYTIEVPPGQYRAFATAPGRTTSPPVGFDTQFEVAVNNTRSVSFNMGARATLSWRIEGDDGRAPPIKVSVEGIEGTPTPDFGPLFRGDGAESFVQSPRGMGELAIGPGQYRVYVSRGPEYELIVRTINARAGERSEVIGKMERVIDTHGFISADLHQHAAPSFDSGVSPVDRVVSNAVEGVEVMVSTEHNVVTDYRPIVAEQGLGRTLVSVVGTEATTHSVGHFNAFPLAYSPGKLRGGMIDPEGLSPREIFDYLRGLRVPEVAPFLQVNHPRSNKTGYFDLMQLDPATGIARDPRFAQDFEGLEVVTFGRAQETYQAMEDWFALIRTGLRITGTGTSDSHTIAYREVGWPRTYVCVDHDDPPHLDIKSFIEGLRSGCATISSGPFLTIESGSVRMGGLVRASGGRVDVTVTLRAPTWIPAQELTLFVDGRPALDIPIASRDILRYQGTHTFTCKSDCFVVARVRSDEELPPVLAKRPDYYPRAFALTNPLYVDVDGDDRFAPQAAPRAEGGSP